MARPTKTAGHILTGFPVFERFNISLYLFRVAPDERIQELAAQLFRAEHPDVLDTVAAQLHLAIDEHVTAAKCGCPMLSSCLLPVQKSA